MSNVCGSDFVNIVEIICKISVIPQQNLIIGKNGSNIGIGIEALKVGHFDVIFCLHQFLGGNGVSLQLFNFLQNIIFQLDVAVRMTRLSEQGK